MHRCWLQQCRICTGLQGRQQISSLDCVLPECFEGDKVIHFSGIIATKDPSLVLFREESHVVENMDADVNRVLVCDRVT